MSNLSKQVAITYVGREDLDRFIRPESVGQITDDDLEWIARYMEARYLQQGYYKDLQVALYALFVDKGYDTRLWRED